MKESVRIVGANKNVRKIFSSVEEAETHIKKNKLFPASKDTPLKIEVTTVKYHKVDVEIPELSKDIKLTLLQILKDNISDIDFMQMRITGNIHDYYYMKGGKGNNYYKYLHDFIQKRYNVSDVDMERYYSKFSWEHGGVEAPYEKDLTNHHILANFAPKIITDLIDSAKLEDIKFRYIQTNYKPCHNINISIDNQLFQIRSNDILFNEGLITGRNVSVTNTSELTDERFKSFIKTTKYSK